MNTNTKRLTTLAKTFPDLNGVLGSDPFNAEALLRWLDGPGAIGGGYHAAQFVLMVAGIGHSFDVVTAMVTWNEQCRLAFLNWAADPWTAQGR